MNDRHLKEKLYIYFLSELFYWGYFKYCNRFVKYNKIFLSEYSGTAIYALWHGRQYAILSTPQEKRNTTNILVSPSNDGEIITRNLHKAGFKTIRGSQKRKGTEAAIKCIRSLKKGNSLFYNVDGPIGPIHKVKEGLITIAKKSGIPIIPINADSKHKYSFNSWDKYTAPKLYAKPTVVFGEPIYVPSDISKEDTEKYRLKVENKIKDLEKIVLENI